MVYSFGNSTWPIFDSLKMGTPVSVLSKRSIRTIEPTSRPIAWEMNEPWARWKLTCLIVHLSESIVIFLTGSIP